VLITCNLSVTNISGPVLIENLTNYSGSDFSYTINNLSDGVHYWNTTCIDDFNNSNFSITQNFTINQPDLYLTTDNITFNDTNPDPNINITIFANVSNIGGSPATNVLVRFYDGYPWAGGIIIGSDTANVGVNTSVLFNVSFNITEGYHTIFVTTDPENTVDEENETNNNATKNISTLVSRINDPANVTWTSQVNTTLNFTIADYAGATLNYTIFVDGSANGQNGTVSDNVSTLLNVTLTQGLRQIIVQAEDALGRFKNSTVLYRYVDWTPPSSLFLTPNMSWFNTTNISVYANITDNLDSVMNYTLYVNGIINQTGFIGNGSNLTLNLTNLANGTYELILEAYDNANNYANSTALIIYIDTVKPFINLTYPDNNSNFTSQPINLNFTVTDNMDTTMLCNLSLDDNSTYRYNFTANNGSNVNTSVSGLTEGTHEWNVTCVDSASNWNISETRTFTIFTVPYVYPVAPDPNTWNNTDDIIFFFNVSDETGLENCSILFNGSINDTKTTANLTNDAINNFTVNDIPDGYYNWAVECYDNTSYNTYNVTENRSIYIDTTPPVPNITTQNDTWFNAISVLININISDNLDPIINYTMYVNGSANVSGFVFNGVANITNITGLTNGQYELILEGIDEAGNRQNSSPVRIYVDLVKPYINLTYPENDTNFSTTTVSLNFTATDNLAGYMNCNITLDDNATYRININATNGTDINTTASNLNGGYHYWNVTCIDRANNTNTSLTFMFYVKMPDLTSTNNDINFSNTNPRENETINISAVIYNNGTSGAGIFVVQFWSGDPDISGVQINGNITVNGLNASSNITVSVLHNVSIGTNNIFLVIDPPLVTNGNVSEENESNNKFNNTLYVGLWHFVFGTTDDEIIMADSSLTDLFNWSVSNSTGSNIFVVDSDSSIGWSSLQAISRNVSNVSNTDDFDEIDSAFGSTGYTDSVNVTYNSDSGPIEVQSYTVYRRLIENVPVANSTNNTNFKTGILWDTSDPNFGGYNGTQDLAFITIIKKSTQGYNDTYDYEVRIPAPLRSYIGPGSNDVSFYLEIK
jgi:hypothetical protein